jgi:hypothetical protein
MYLSTSTKHNYARRLAWRAFQARIAKLIPEVSKAVLDHRLDVSETLLY